MKDVNWNLTAVSIYPNGMTQQHTLHPTSYRMYGVKLNGKRPIVMSIPEAMEDPLRKACDYVMNPTVSRDNILTHTADGPDMDRINKIVFPNDQQLHK